MTSGMNPAAEISLAQICVHIHAGKHPNAPQNAFLDGASLVELARIKSGNGMRNAKPQSENGGKARMMKRALNKPAMNAPAAAFRLETFEAILSDPVYHQRER